MDQTSLQDGGAIERLIGGKEVRANLEASKKYVLQQQGPNDACILHQQLEGKKSHKDRRQAKCWPVLTIMWPVGTSWAGERAHFFSEKCNPGSAPKHLIVCLLTKNEGDRK